MTHPELLRKAVDAYGQVLPNLRRHRADFPPYEHLKSLIRDGSNGDPHTVGPGRDSEASDWIIRVLDRDDPRPVWFAIWDGRFERSGRGEEFLSAKDLRDGMPDMLYPVHRWRAAYQSDFEARMDWCVKPPAQANHAPAATLNGDGTRRVLQIETDPNAEVKLSTAGSSSPDGHPLRFRWWGYVEAGAYWAAPEILGAEAADATVKIPADASGRSLIMPRFSLDPPQWCLDRHPQEELSCAGPRKANHRHSRRSVSLSSKLYKA